MTRQQTRLDKILSNTKPDEIVKISNCNTSNATGCQRIKV